MHGKLHGRPKKVLCIAVIIAFCENPPGGMRYENYMTALEAERVRRRLSPMPTARRTATCGSPYLYPSMLIFSEHVLLSAIASAAVRRATACLLRERVKGLFGNA